MGPVVRSARRWLAASAVALSRPLALTGPRAEAAGRGQPETIPNEWIVVLTDGTSPRAVAAEHAKEHGAEVRHVYEHALKGYAARMSETAAARVAADRRVVSVQPDQKVAIAAQTLPTGINRIDGELSSAVSGDGTGTVDVDVAVIDTGIATHPDLNVVGGKNCTLVGRLLGRSAEDDHGHGTHVAGTIGARDDGDGVVGVAPGARLYAVKVLNAAGAGTTSDIVCGIDWVTARAKTTNPIEVANMSLGGAGSEPAGAGCATGNAQHDAICRSVAAGVTYVVAAGNDSADAASYVPAAYDEVVTVAALADFNGLAGGGAASTCRSDEDDTFANFSNSGADVDLIAPGVCINSTWLNKGYNTISGTSMASPHVAGAAALYKASNASATPAQVKAALQAAGNLDWTDTDDPDPVKEPLLNVDAF